MPNNNDAKKIGRKTNNSQSAGMTSGTSSTPVVTSSVPQSTPQTRALPEIDNDDTTKSETVQGASSGEQVIGPLQNPEDLDEDNLGSDYNSSLRDFGELTPLGIPYRANDLPLDQKAYSEITVEFPSCKEFSSYGDSEKGLKKSERVFSTAGRYFQALKLGEEGLRRPIPTSAGKNMSRNERKRIFSEELGILNELLTNLYCFKDEDRVGYALQRIILINLNQRLRARREQAEEDLVMSGDGIPSIPRWGLTGKADEFWTANDFEILGACYRREVESFLSYLNNHHDFPAARKELKPKARAASPATSTESLSERSSVRPPTPTVVAPVFAPGEADSISRFQRPSSLSYTFRTPGNLNTSVFGHPAQNSSSRAFRELLGAGQSKKGRSGRVEINSPPPAASVIQANQNTSGGAPGPGDSDGDDSDDGGGNRPSGNPRVPRSSRRNPFENSSHQAATVSSTRTPVEPQFDTKLKMDAIPTWDGNPESLRRWFVKLNSLSKRSDVIFKQLGMLVPTRLTGSAETWYYSQNAETRERIESDWGTLRAAIGEYYMNRSFLDKQKARANKASYRDPGYGRELPSEYVIRKVELLQFVYNYTDNELINEVMESAPSYWIPIVTPHLYQTLEQFQLAVKFHEDALMKSANEVVSPIRNQYYSKDVPAKSPFNPFRSQRAHVNLVGWSQATSKPQFPKDDSNVSPRGTPKEKGARPCRHCGSDQHWDRDCKYARKGERSARVNMITIQEDEKEAQDKYDDLYYGTLSDDDDIDDKMDQQDFQKPSQ